MMEVQEAIDRIYDEYINKATKKFDKMKSRHEGYAVIKEELEELWDEVKGQQNIEKLIEEASHVGAMALRFLVDLC